MQESERSQVEKALEAHVGRLEAVVPNPNLKLLARVREIMRLRHYLSGALDRKPSTSDLQPGVPGVTSVRVPPQPYSDTIRYAPLIPP